MRCTYVQSGQGRTPRAPGRLSHSCRIVHAHSARRAMRECIEPEMTVAAASAMLVAHFGRSRCMSAVFGCIPRASTQEISIARSAAPCRVQCPIPRIRANSCLREREENEDESKALSKKVRRREEATGEREKERNAGSWTARSDASEGMQLQFPLK